MTEEKITLHEAIIQILLQNGGFMTTASITDKLNQTGLYKRADGSDVCDFQVHSRTFNRKDLFLRDGSLIKLRKTASLKFDEKLTSDRI